jgi:hypothetical protein
VSFDTVADFRREWPCQNCAGVAQQIWLRAPGLAGVEEPSTRGIRRTFQPGYDVQSGRVFNSRTEREKWAKGRGLEGLGPEEFKRTKDAVPSDPEPDFSGLPAAMNDAYNETKAGVKGPPLARIGPETKPIIVGE